jgi:Rieske Fe-S protein
MNPDERDMEHNPEQPPAQTLPRRRMLVVLSVIGAGVSAIAASAASVAAFAWPATRKPEPKGWTKVVDDVNDVDIGTPFKVDFAETVDDAWIETRTLRSVWVYTEDGATFRAFSGVCTHLGCSFFLDAETNRFHCPCHHGLFDSKTGAVVGGPPPRPLDALEVKVENDAVYVRYETFLTGIPEKVAT